MVGSMQTRKLAEAAEEGNITFIKEKKETLGRKNYGQIIPESLDSRVGHDSILERFRECYEELYNSAGTEVAMASIRNKLQSFIRENNINGQADIQKVTGSIVKQACSKMKPGKTDVTGVYTSDVFLNAPDSLFDHLAAIFRSFLSRFYIVHSCPYSRVE